jgi:hypothetical protein
MILLMEKNVPNSPQTVILLAGKRKVLPGDEVMIFWVNYSSPPSYSSLFS